MSNVRNSLVGKELDRLSGVGFPAVPKVPPELQIDRGQAAYANGVEIRGLRVEAYNTCTRTWSLGVIQSVHLRSHRRTQWGEFVIAYIEHEDPAVRARAYEVSFLRKVLE